MSMDRSRLSSFDFRNGFYITLHLYRSVLLRGNIQYIYGSPMDNLRFHMYVSQIPAVSSRRIDPDEISRWSRVHFVKFSSGPPRAGNGLFI